MDVPRIARVTFTSEDRVRDVIHDVNADGIAEPGPADPTVVICVDEFGPLNLQPHPGRQWALRGGGGAGPRRRRRATYTRPPAYGTCSAP